MESTHHIKTIKRFLETSALVEDKLVNQEKKKMVSKENRLELNKDSIFLKNNQIKSKNMTTLLAHRICLLPINMHLVKNE